MKSRISSISRISARTPAGYCGFLGYLLEILDIVDFYEPFNLVEETEPSSMENTLKARNSRISALFCICKDGWGGGG